MSNPFFSNNINFVDESFYSATPTYINGQNVFVSQEKNRKLWESLNTSIVGNPQNNFNGFNSYGLDRGNIVQAEKHFLPPSGVLFTFSTPYSMSAPQLYNSTGYNPKNYFPCTSTPRTSRKNYRQSTGQDGIGLTNINQTFGATDYQQLSQNPFFFQCQHYPFHKLKFHLDSETSCTDLLNANTQIPGSQGTADFRNLSGLNYQREHGILYQGHQDAGTRNAFFHDDAAQTSCDGKPSGVRQLTICTPSTPTKGHVADVLVEDPNANMQKSTTCDKGEQTSFSLDEEDADRRNSNGKGKKLMKKKYKKKGNDDSSSDEEKCPCRSRRGKRKKPPERKRDTEHETSSSTTTE